MNHTNAALADASAALQAATACPHDTRAIRRANEIDARAKRERFLLCLDTHDREAGRVYPAFNTQRGQMWEAIADKFAAWFGVEPDAISQIETDDGDRITIAGAIVGRTTWGRA